MLQQADVGQHAGDHQHHGPGDVAHRRLTVFPGSGEQQDQRDAHGEKAQVDLVHQEPKHEAGKTDQRQRALAVEPL